MPNFTQCVEIIIKGNTTTTSGGSKHIFNVFHYRLMTGTMDTMGQLLGDFDSKVFSFVRALLAASYTTTSLNARLMDDVTNLAFTNTLSVVGGKPLPRLPAFTCVVMPYFCAQRGREFRGRKFFGPIVEADATADELTPAAKTAWDGVIPKLAQVLSSVNGTYQQFVLSRKLSQLVKNPPTIVGSDVVWARTNLALGSLDRRKERVVSQ
jgi:hypothetical protein